MDYSEYTIPKEVEESDRRQREDPNYRRPRKLPPRIVFRSVVEKANQERVAVGGAPLLQQQNTRRKRTRDQSQPPAAKVDVEDDDDEVADDEDIEDNEAEAMDIFDEDYVDPDAPYSPNDDEDMDDDDEDMEYEDSSSSSSSASNAALAASATTALPHAGATTAFATLSIPGSPTTPTVRSTIHPSIHLPSAPVAPMPTYGTEDRLGRRHDSWTYTEAMATTSLIQHAFHELPYGAGGYGEPVALRMVDKYALVAEMLEKVYGIRKTAMAVKNWWERDGRRLTGMGDEKQVRPEGVPDGVEPARVVRAGSGTGGPGA